MRNVSIELKTDIILISFLLGKKTSYKYKYLISYEMGDEPHLVPISFDEDTHGVPCEATIAGARNP